VVDYNHHLGYDDKGNRMANSYTNWLSDKEVDEKAIFPFVQTSHSEVTYFFFHVVGRKFHTQIFNLPF
jgi:hypothetical protein